MDAHAEPELDTVQAFATPELIAFEFRLAGPAVRALAWLVDLLLRAMVFVLLAIPFAYLDARVGRGLACVLYFALDWLSGGLCEWLWQGQTPGKRAMGIKVVGVDGLPAGAVACLLRNVLRWADGLPYVSALPTFAVGLLAMVSSRGFQRLGDLAAGTVVVYSERRLPPRPPAPADGPAVALAAQLPPEAARLLDGRAVSALSAYVARRRQFHPERRAGIAENLAGPLRRRLGLDARVDADALLCALHLVLFPADPGPTPIAAGGTAAAVLARRRPDWLRLEARLAGDRRQPSPSGEPPAAEAARLYRAACADLALAGAYHLPRPVITYLHQLVAQAHLRFYRRIEVPWSALRHRVLVEVPGRLCGDTCLRVALVAFFGVFAGATLAAWTHPPIATGFLGEAALAGLRDLYADAPHGRAGADGAMMGGFYIVNNLGIAMACFASGIFAGIGSLVWLAFNGLSLGLMFGHMAALDDAARAHFFEFVSAHGPFELTGIALAGAAGLRLGLGLVVRQGLPRAHALRRSAAEAVPVMGVAAALIALAAPIEAFVSPSALPLAAKRGMMWLCILVLVVYFIGLGIRGRRLLAAREPGRGSPP